MRSDNTPSSVQPQPRPKSVAGAAATDATTAGSGISVAPAAEPATQTCTYRGLMVWSDYTVFLGRRSGGVPI